MVGRIATPALIPAFSTDQKLVINLQRLRHEKSLGVDEDVRPLIGGRLDEWP